MRILEARGGTVFEILVKPRSREFRIVIGEDEIVAFCREEPIRGKVNKELVNELSRLLHKKVKLISGSSSNQKRLFVEGVKATEVEQALLRG